MTDRDAMIAACISTFDEESKQWIDTRADDTPRLVYADWLEENGEPERAEFVRVQCELARWPDTVGKPEERTGLWHELRRRERELLCREWMNDGDKLPSIQWAEWAKESHAAYCLNIHTGNPLSPPNTCITFSRGFVSRIRCSWDNWLRVESRLVWVPGGTVECPNRCQQGSFRYDREYVERVGHGVALRICKVCGQTGRIPRPFVTSMQPVEVVELTDVTPEPIHVAMQLDGHTFTREKCPKCQSIAARLDHARQHSNRRCPDCKDRYLNSWTCESWPMQRFVMLSQRQPLQPFYSYEEIEVVNSPGP